MEPPSSLTEEAGLPSNKWMHFTVEWYSVLENIWPHLTIKTGCTERDGVIVFLFFNYCRVLAAKKKIIRRK